MNKKVLLTAIGALLIVTGCSKQPSLENAQNTQNNTQVTATETTTESSAVEGGSVNTTNAEVETQKLQENTEATVTVGDKNFAKKLSSIVIYFDFDKYNIRKDQWPKVEKLAELIKSNPNNYTVRIEGNCDEWGTEEYNYALGLKRANSVKKALIELGVDPKKLTVISYGELNPVCTAHARWCWRLNRRDNFTYLP